MSYAAKPPGTAGSAPANAEEFGRAGLAVDVLPVDRARSIGPYDAVALGSATCFGRRRREALGIGRRYAEAPRGRPPADPSAAPEPRRNPAPP